MGLLSWEKRQSFHLLRKTPQLLRELKSLDDQTCRETHKIALIYIAEGQDDKMSILSNEGGSPDYEYFLGKLAWTVDLETHEGKVKSVIFFLPTKKILVVFLSVIFFQNKNKKTIFWKKIHQLKKGNPHLFI
jgi:hypothetical protein